jgi:type VI secretion system secreted protein VgrG
VIVSFLEGDPDRPIITGRVYNAEQTVPYDLPENATQSGMKSRSSKGGSPANFNEIRMEDKKGAEQLYIHAERNQDIVVEVDESHSVGHDRNKRIGHNETVTIGANRLCVVRNNDTLLVGGAKSDSAATRYTVEAGDSIRLVCGDSVIELTADGAINLTCGSFNLFSSGSGKIQTKGKLDINQGSDKGTSSGQQGVRATIHNAVESTFADTPGAGQ